MSSTNEAGSDTIHHVISSGGGVYSTRRESKVIDKTLATDRTSQALDEENGSVIEKDVLDERDIRVKQSFGTWQTLW
jgi:hypothetical protein